MHRSNVQNSKQHQSFSATLMLTPCQPSEIISYRGSSQTKTSKTSKTCFSSNSCIVNRCNTSGCLLGLTLGEPSTVQGRSSNLTMPPTGTILSTSKNANP